MKLLHYISLVVLLVVIASTYAPPTIYAGACSNGNLYDEGDLGAVGVTPEQFCADKGGVSSTAPPSRVKNDCSPKPGETLSAGNCGIIKYIQYFSNFLSAVVGMVVVIMIIIGGIQYSTAGDNPQAVAAGKQKIKNSIIALFLWIFMSAFLQWIIPGGLF